MVQGFQQRKGIDYHQSFAPTIKMAAIRLIFALATLLNYVVHHIDFSNAFTQGDIDTQVFMRQPTGHVDPNHPHRVCRLLKGLYGIVQGARL